MAQVAPQDSNQTDSVMAFYAENSQRLFDDRVVLRAGLRHTRGSTSFDPTPNLANQQTGSRPYTATTYTVGGTYRATEALSLRTGLSTGFRAPIATELAGDYTVLAGGQIFGNPSLRPETSRHMKSARRSRERFQRRRGPVPEHDLTPDHVPAAIRKPEHLRLRQQFRRHRHPGIELQASLDMMRAFATRSNGWHWSVFANGGYNFDMRDFGVSSSANSRQVQRAYKYQAAIGTRFGQRSGVAIPWTFSVTGILRGPTWYDTEETLVIPAGEPSSSYIHQKPAFWVWNARLEGELRKGLTAYVAMNNIFNVNQHALFIALDQQPFIGNASVSNTNGIGNMGNSMPGREVVIGLKAAF